MIKEIIANSIPYIYIISPANAGDVLELQRLKADGQLNENYVLIDKMTAEDSKFISVLLSSGIKNFSVVDDGQYFSGLGLLNKDNNFYYKSLYSAVQSAGGTLKFAKLKLNGSLEFYDFNLKMKEIGDIAQVIDNINNSNILGRPLSQIERVFYAYCYITKFFERREFRRKNLGKFDFNIQQRNSLFSRENESYNLAETLNLILNSVGVPSVVERVKKSILNTQEDKVKTAKLNNACMMIIDDDLYNVHGVYHSIPKFDYKNLKGSTIGSALLKYKDIVMFFNRQNFNDFKQSKTEVENFNEKEIYNLTNIVGTREQNSFTRSFVTFDKIKEDFLLDLYFDGAFSKSIENFCEKLNELKAKSKSITRNIMYGEGHRKLNDNVINFPNEIFENLFKMVCLQLKIGELKGQVEEKERQKQKDELEDLERDVKLIQVKAKVLAEEYEGVTPKVYKDAMEETAKTKEYFVENSNFAKQYEEYYRAKFCKDIANNFKLDKLDENTDGVSIEIMEESLKNSLLAMGLSQEEAETEAGAIIFASVYKSSLLWEKKYSQKETDNDIYKVIKKSSVKNDTDKNKE